MPACHKAKSGGRSLNEPERTSTANAHRKSVCLFRLWKAMRLEAGHGAQLRLLSAVVFGLFALPILHCPPNEPER